MTIKAILDTNVVISGIFWKGPPFEILTAWQKQRFHLVISLPILDEYRRVLADYVVSGDAALLKLKNYERIKIVRPAEFLKVL